MPRRTSAFPLDGKVSGSYRQPLDIFELGTGAKSKAGKGVGFEGRGSETGGVLSKRKLPKAILHPFRFSTANSDKPTGGAKSPPWPRCFCGSSGTCASSHPSANRPTWRFEVVPRVKFSLDFAANIAFIGL